CRRVHGVSSPRLHRGVHPLGLRARHRGPDGSNSPGAAKLSAASLLLSPEERRAADLPHAVQPHGSRALVVPLAGAEQSHPAQPGRGPGHAQDRAAATARRAERIRGRTRDVAARHRRAAGPARSRHPGNVLLNRNPPHRVSQSETVQPGPGARDAVHLAGQREKGSHHPHRRAGRGVDRQVSARGASAARQRPGRRHGVPQCRRRPVSSRPAQRARAGTRRSREAEQTRGLPYVPPHHGDADARRRRRYPLHPADARPRGPAKHAGLHASLHPQPEADPHRHASRRNAGETAARRNRRRQQRRRATESRPPGRARKRGGGRRIAFGSEALKSSPWHRSCPLQSMRMLCAAESGPLAPPQPWRSAEPHSAPSLPAAHFSTEIFSLAARARTNAEPVNPEKPHQGVASQKTAPHQAKIACNSTTALGLSWQWQSGTASGARVTYDYDAWGNTVNTAGSTPNVYLYGGDQYDTDLGLYYLR